MKKFIAPVAMMVVTTLILFVNTASARKFEKPNLSNNKWQVLYGGDVSGDGKLQAAVIDIRRRAQLMMERGKCAEKSVGFTIAAGSERQQSKLNSMFGGAERMTVELLSASSKRDISKSITLTNDEMGGLEFRLPKEVLRREMSRATKFFICKAKKLRQSRCLSFTTSGLLAAVMSLCPQSRE